MALKPPHRAFRFNGVLSVPTDTEILVNFIPRPDLPRRTEEAPEEGSGPGGHFLSEGTVDRLRDVLDRVFVPYFEAIRRKDLDGVASLLDDDVRVTFEGENHRDWLGKHLARQKFAGRFDKHEELCVSRAENVFVVETPKGRVCVFSLTFRDRDGETSRNMIYGLAREGDRIACIHHCPSEEKGAEGCLRALERLGAGPILQQ